ncbi:hypothetical protein [Streptomyces sp. DG1A-41]
MTGLWTDIAAPTGLRTFAEQNRALTFEGRMVDEAMAETARAVLARHGRG